MKTNAMRALEQRGIAYKALTYDADIGTADGVARALDVSCGQVFKTLVLTRITRRHVLLMVAGNKEVDMRALAREIDTKEVRLALKREAERMTGLQTGGIGALALLNKPFDVMIDEAALDHESILVNGGRRGLNLRVRTTNLTEITGARLVKVVSRLS